MADSPVTDDRLNYRRPIADSEIPEGAQLCGACHGYTVLVQAPLSKVPPSCLRS